MLSGAKKKGVAKYQIGGPISPEPQEQAPGMGNASASGPMGTAAPGTAMHPGFRPNVRIGY